MVGGSYHRKITVSRKKRGQDLEQEILPQEGEARRSAVQCPDRFSTVQVQLNVVLYPLTEDR
jgi:hypothetical protein